MKSRTNQLIKFLTEIEKLKHVVREIYCSGAKRKENATEHSWHLAMFIMLFDQDLPKNLDKLKMLKMALIHDLPEINCGDTFAFDKSDKKLNKTKLELESAKKLFAQLPEDLNKKFMKLFLEYENSTSKEAKFVQSFDKIQPILQNLCSNGKSWIKHGIKYQEINDYKRSRMTHNRLVLKIYSNLLREAKKKKYI